MRRRYLGISPYASTQQIAEGDIAFVSEKIPKNPYIGELVKCFHIMMIFYENKIRNRINRIIVRATN